VSVRLTMLELSQELLPVWDKPLTGDILKAVKAIAHRSK
jgi:hypothetical protein